MGIWNSAGGMKALATGLLALALAGIAASLAASRKAVDIQGPGALRAVAEDTLWLGVDEDLWVLDRQGRRTALRTAEALGLTEGISNIVPLSASEVLLTTRGDAHWQVVDRSTLAVLRTVRPRWPAEFRDNYLRAIHLAAAPGGDIAVATGGGHAVLLFDRQGRFKARTGEGTYRFTNGLWWSPEGWWTTDTNRFALKLLDAATLEVKRTIALQRTPVDFPYLGEALASQGGHWPGTDLPPLATLSRVGYLMEPGYVVDVFPNGLQVPFHRDLIAQLRDIGWFDGHLLAVDGETFTLRRWDAQRMATEPFGDATVRAAFAKLRADRAFWRTIGSRHAFLVAAFLLLAGVGAYARHRQLATREVVAAREAGYEPPAEVPAAELARQRVRLYAVPLAVRLGVLALSAFVLFPLLHWWLIGSAPRGLTRSLQLLVLCVAVPAVLVALWQQRRHERLAARADCEGALNQKAVEWLRAHDDFDRVKLEGEIPRETVLLVGWRPRWLLVTNRRILLFVANGRDRRLQSEWPRRAVVFAGVPPPTPWWRQLLVLPPNLVLTFTTGTTLAVRCASAVTARRVAQLLMASPALPDEQGMFSPAAAPERRRRRWHEVLASFAVPGTGQWLQGRFATGVVLFTAALLLCIYVWGPVLWALHGPKMEVSARSIANAVLAWLFIALVAGSDAWRFSGTRRQ